MYQVNGHTLTLYHPDAPDQLPGPSLVMRMSRDFAGWVIVQTRYRREKVLANYLQMHGVPYFLPMVRSTASSPTNPDRTSRNNVQVPLLPDFLFMCHILPRQHIRTGEVCPDHLSSELIARKSGHVLTFLRTQNQERLKAELVAISLGKRHLVHNKAKSSQILEEGREVFVIAGPYSGLIGRVAPPQPSDHHLKDHERVAILLSILGETVSFLLPRDNVVPRS